MRVGVIGAGAVGGTIAALLDRAGHEVQVTARGEHLERIEHAGLHLSGRWGEHVARLRAAAHLSEELDLVVIATKVQDAEAALKQNARALRGIPLVVVQNGLTGITTARALAPEARVLGGLALFASSYLAPGKIGVTAPGSIVLGGHEPGDDAVAELAARLFGDVMPVAVTDNFTGAQWTKLVINQVNALPAITGTSVQQVVADSRLRRILTAAMRENVRVGLALGIRFDPVQAMTHPLLRLFARLPLSVGQLLPIRMAARMGSVPNPASTLQSIRRGQPTEVDYLNGAVVEAAQRLGLAAPVNAAMVELVHEVERTGRFLAADEAADRVRRLLAKR